MYKEIFQKLENNHIRNDLSFPIWIYDIENIIVRNNRYLRLFLFNRYFDNRETNQIVVVFHEKEYDIRNFSIITDFSDKNVFGCNILIPIDYDDYNVAISKEIVDGHTFFPSGEAREYTRPEPIFNQKQNDILETVFKNYSFTPGVFGNYYQCCCGRINNTDQKCRCGRDIADLNRIFEYDFDTYILNDYLKTHPFSLEYGDIFQDALEGYCGQFNKLEPQIDVQRVISSIDNDQTRNKFYSQACNLFASNKISEVERAAKLFNFLTGFKDSDDKKKEADDRAAELKKAEAERIKKEKQKKTITIAAVSSAAIILVLLTIFVFIPMNKYSKATKMMQDGKFEDAIAVFSEIENYKDSETQIKECYYSIANDLKSNNNFDEAAEIFFSIKDYKDSAQLINECSYMKAGTLRNAGQYDEAANIFSSLGDYKDSKELVNHCKYEKAVGLYNEQKWKDAFAVFKNLNGFLQSNDYMENCNDKYIENLTVDVSAKYNDWLNQSDPNSTSAKSYVTIKSITYTVYDSNIEFDFVVYLDVSMNTSFFSPPSGAYFMKTRGLSSGTNRYSFSVPARSIKSSNYSITCKFYTFGSRNITGYLTIQGMEELLNSKDLYGNAIFDI